MENVPKKMFEGTRDVAPLVLFASQAQSSEFHPQQREIVWWCMPVVPALGRMR